jgi:hypothetical protein
MKIEIDNYKIVSALLTGTNLRIVFQHRVDTNNRKVLELKHTAGFINNTINEQEIKILRIDEEGGSYCLDLSMRLKQPEIVKYPEVFIFTDAACVHFCFRAVAKVIDFRAWNEKDNWLP